MQQFNQLRARELWIPSSESQTHKTDRKRHESELIIFHPAAIRIKAREFTFACWREETSRRRCIIARHRAAYSQRLRVPRRLHHSAHAHSPLDAAKSLVAAAAALGINNCPASELRTATGLSSWLCVEQPLVDLRLQRVPVESSANSCLATLRRQLSCILTKLVGKCAFCLRARSSISSSRQLQVPLANFQLVRQKQNKRNGQKIRAKQAGAREWDRPLARSLAFMRQMKTG